MSHLPPKHRVKSWTRVGPTDEDDVEVSWVFGGDDFQTRFHAVGRVAIPPRRHFVLDSADEFEWCVVPLSGDLRYEGQNERLDVAPGAVVLATQGQGDHNLVNKSASLAEALVATVGLGEAADARIPGESSTIGCLDQSLLSPFQAHLGLGEIQFRSLFVRSSSAWNSIDHVRLPPGTSIGLHKNHNVEEVFVILQGRGTMQIESETIEVAEGDCILNPLGGVHGIINLDGTILDFLNLSVSVDNEPADVTDLGDSLSGLIGT